MASDSETTVAELRAALEHSLAEQACDAQVIKKHAQEIRGLASRTTGFAPKSKH